jgi:S1/P1 Nuclease
MKKIAVAVLTSFVLLFSTGRLFAWSSPGHMTIAAIAYRDLSADDKRKVTELLKHHPNYESWKTSFPTNAQNLDLETFVFMRASTWPDEIRRRGSPYDHPEWHYVDYPLEPPTFPEKPSPFPTNDIVYGMGQCENILKEQNSSLEERAVYLSWLIHLVGDIHQPLHCSTLVNQDYPAPVGDKGGNEFFVKPVTAGVNLHSIWDKALGGTVNPRTQFNYAIQISTEHPRASLPELSKDKTPVAWSKESRAIAIESGYLRGKLAGSTQRDDAPALPEGYTKSMKTIAEKQAALAGYRLADEIRDCVSP